jgi:NitT/TauT family transport system substrate-binding protein
MDFMRRIVMQVTMSALLLVAGSIVATTCALRADAQQTIRYGLTPYQDSALPVVAEKLGWYNEKGLNVRLVSVTWSDVPLALASGDVDLSIYNFDSFMAPWKQLADGGTTLVFYAPLYIWNGAAIMVHREDPSLRPVGDLEGLSTEEQKRRVASAVKQLKGKRIAITEGTTYEQTVLAALELAGLDPKRDVTLINAQPQDSLAAFLANSVDAFSAGLTERVNAKEHGAVELVVGADFSLPPINGIVTTTKFANAHSAEMDTLTALFFKTVRFMNTDMKAVSTIVLQYLRGKASVDYTPEQYAIALKTDYLPETAKEAYAAFQEPGSRYYWRLIWDGFNKFLITSKKIREPVPYSAYLGDESLKRVKALDR